MSKGVVTLPSEVKEELDALVKYDATFLRDHGIMDYSTYLVVERFEGFLNEETRHEFQSQLGGELYHVSIIDYLQTWTKEKKSEQYFKMYLKRKSIKGLSCIEPNAYCERFITSMS